MSEPAPTRAALARELCQQYPTYPTRGIARILYHQNPALFPNLEAARKAVAYARGKNGKISRKQVVNTGCSDTPGFGEILPAGTGSRLACPPSLAEPWTPFFLPPGNGLNLSDIHLPYHSEIAVTAAIQHAKRKHIDWILLNGDIADFYSVSRWDKNPKKRNLAGEIEIVKQFLQWLRQEFPNAFIVYKQGNHEERWDKFIWNKAPELFDLPQCRWDAILDLASLGIESVTDGRPVMAGGLPIFHGHELPKGLASPVNQARGAFMRLLHTSMTAHGHRSSTHPEPNLWHSINVSWSQGCLCDLRPEYARINKWNWGFAEIENLSDDTFEVDNLRISREGEVRRV